MSKRSKKEDKIKDSPYLKFKKHDLILRDELAVDRTLLSNERTLLAYLRSGVALLIAGVSIIHFTHSGWFWIFGVVCIPIGIIIGIIGIIRYRRMKSSIFHLRMRSEKETNKTAEEPKP